MKELSINERIMIEFANIDNALELRKIANSLCVKVSNAYSERLAQIMKNTPKTKAVRTQKENVPEAKPTKAQTPKVKQVPICSLTKAQIKKMGLHFERYSEKCQLLMGETKPIKDEIKYIGKGHWYAKKEGWFLTNKNAEVLAKMLKIKTA